MQIKCVSTYLGENHPFKFMKSYEVNEDYTKIKGDDGKDYDLLDFRKVSFNDKSYYFNSLFIVARELLKLLKMSSFFSCYRISGEGSIIIMYNFNTKQSYKITIEEID